MPIKSPPGLVVVEILDDTGPTTYAKIVGVDAGDTSALSWLTDGRKVYIRRKDAASIWDVLPNGNIVIARSDIVAYKEGAD